MEQSLSLFLDSLEKLFKKPLIVMIIIFAWIIQAMMVYKLF